MVSVQSDGRRQALIKLLLRFWFFAARNNPDTAPLSIWLNGGVSVLILEVVLRRLKVDPGYASLEAPA